MIDGLLEEDLIKKQKINKIGVWNKNQLFKADF